MTVTPWQGTDARQLARVECGFDCTGGTATSADECTSVCGDGIKTASEECDDNNSNDNDGCDSACFIEAGYTARPQTAQCPSAGPRAATGIGLAVEGCDDGDSESGDGCSSTCEVEADCGYTCTGGTPTTRDECTSSCGDGYLAPDEACDDGNSVNDDGCSSTCSIEQGWVCSTPACGLTTCNPVCGDGFVVGNEQCDDFRRRR